MTGPGPRPLPEMMRVGIARNLRDLRAHTGLTLREVVAPLGWSSHNELARYERVTETTDGKESDVRPISIHRYAQLIKLYSDRLPKHRDTQPGFVWARSPEGQAFTGSSLQQAATAKARGEKSDKGHSMVSYLVYVNIFLNVGALSCKTPSGHLVEYYKRLGAPTDVE